MNPPQLGAMEKGPPGGGEGPKRTRGGGQTGTSGLGGATPPQLRRSGMGPQGGPTGPSIHMVDGRTVTGRVGGDPPHN